MSYLNGRVVVITGAGSGFGRLVAQKAAGRGARIVACDVNESALQETLESITSAGQAAMGQSADVTVATDLNSVVSAAVEAYDGVDVLINSAGIMPLAYYSDHAKALDAWHRCIDINFKGVLNGITAVYDQMIAQGRGHVVNLSSIYSNFPLAGAAVYGATKAAVNFLSDALRQESQGKIKVTTVRPTGIPITGISSEVVNIEAGASIVGLQGDVFAERLGAMMSGDGEAGWTNAGSIEYFMLSPELLCDQILYAIDQPWGVVISDLTVRASGEVFTV
ncbi:MAG: SDR family oxidoreductase [Pseudomonadota bacterium]